MKSPAKALRKKGGGWNTVKRRGKCRREGTKGSYLLSLGCGKTDGAAKRPDNKKGTPGKANESANPLGKTGVVCHGSMRSESQRLARLTTRRNGQGGNSARSKGGSRPFGWTEG